MAIEIPTKPRVCMYCGRATKKTKNGGEHIIPWVIGGALTLDKVCENLVCPKCNNGVLSRVDEELCSRSFLSIAASQKLDAQIWQAWDIDHGSNLLLEAKPKWIGNDLAHLVAYPQMSFLRPGRPDLHGDMIEIGKFGHENFEAVMRKGVRQAFQRHVHGEKRAIHLERIQTDMIHPDYRLIPRVFTRHSIGEIAANVNKQSFILRFVSDEDKRMAYREMDNLSEKPEYKNWSTTPGSRIPNFCTFYDIGDCIRGLMKIGLNLIAAHCPDTVINHTTFKQAMRLILGECCPHEDVIHRMGFLRASDVVPINDAGGGHSFRLIHDAGRWFVFSSFFGGSVGTMVFFPGPNGEKWQCADIVAPIRSKKWTFEVRPLIQPFSYKVQLAASPVIMPSFKLQQSVSSIRVEIGPARPKKTG
jgi:hypothetical protein